VLLIPIGRDDAEIRRHAWISYAIIALNIVAFVAVETASRPSQTAAIERGWNEVGNYLLQHPYLEIPDELAPMVSNEGLLLLTRHRIAYGQPPPADVIEEEQATLDELAANAAASLKTLPHVRFGYVPAEGGFTRLVTSMFVHAGLMHLLGNLLFFYLSGPFIEDVFGRPLFAALYVTGGFAAALTYAARHPDGTVPLVGASGAIAAVMGAYLVRFLRSKVEFLFVPFLLRPMWHFRFFLPAFVVLPLWFGQQALQMLGEGAGSGTAFSAHVGGFAFGFVVAFVVKVSGFEETYVNPAVVKETTWTMDGRTVAAMEAVSSARALEDPAMLDNAAVQLLARYVEEKQSDLAADFIRELTGDVDAQLPKFLARAAVFAERSGDRDWAFTLYQRLLDADPHGPGAVQSLVKIGTLLRVSGNVAGARESFAKARAHPACTAEWAGTIDAKIEALGA
jgi:membrane associated rhomboid family serine protease